MICPTCRNQIQLTEYACPSCGFRLPVQTPQQRYAYEYQMNMYYQQMLLQQAQQQNQPLPQAQSFPQEQPIPQGTPPVAPIRAEAATPQRTEPILPEEVSETEPEPVKKKKKKTASPYSRFIPIIAGTVLGIALLGAVIYFITTRNNDRPDVTVSSPEDVPLPAENNVPGEDVTVPAENNASAEDEEIGDFSEIEALGDVNVDSGLFNVEVTLPSDFVDGVTQEELDSTVSERGFKSATLNTDGSVTYVMTKAKHQELLTEIRQQIDDSLAEIGTSSDYPSISSVTANEDYTHFTVNLPDGNMSLTDSFVTLQLYMSGGMYGIFSGNRADNIQVDFVNEATGEIIETANSKNLQ